MVNKGMEKVEKSRQRVVTEIFAVRGCCDTRLMVSIEQAQERLEKLRKENDEREQQAKKAWEESCRGR